jgi:AcrR family transcriptional regulator
MPVETKTVIMNAAEELFAATGYNATSLRAITQAADVNLAAVNYHFGGKQGLLEAIYNRRITPMNQTRVDLLEKLEKSWVSSPVPLVDLVESFVKPALSMSRDENGKHFVTLLGRSYMEPNPVLQEQVRSMFNEVSERFATSFARTLPYLNKDELYCRMHFMVGVLAYCMSGADLMRMIASSRFLENASSETLINNLVSFICSGMAAPESNEETIESAGIASVT